MKYTSEKLYQAYTSKDPSSKGILARLKQRVKWINGFLESGKFQRKLKQINVLENEQV